ncbi:hypothetical protein MKEN_01259900 [Mycena kentingensis (nom. inval.)]|nr:hypothetical protein MKEN_01259900 [Mycena kentingensis (nom. inval.)]
MSLTLHRLRASYLNYLPELRIPQSPRIPSSMHAHILRRVTPATAILSLCLSGVFLCAVVYRDYTFDRQSRIDGHTTTELSFPDAFDPLDAQTVLNGPPTASFRDNLKPDQKYITSWGSSAGWTNDVISFMNLIYLAQQTNRIPVLPHHTSTHLSWEVQEQMTFGEVFDVPRLSKALAKPIVEWHQVKSRADAVWDEIGCWNVWAPSSGNAEARTSHVTYSWSLDIAYTRAPNYVKLYPGATGDFHASAPALTTLAYPEYRAKALQENKPIESSGSHHTQAPDEQMLCFDYMYYLGTYQNFEFEAQHSPVWNTIGTNMRWNPTLNLLVDEFLRSMFNLDATTPIPPFISVHARRKDFADYCKSHPVDKCLVSTDIYKRRVAEVTAAVYQHKGVHVTHVVMTSDEKDEAWWDEIAAAGWFRPDHTRMQTAEIYGEWYPVLFDAVVQSRGIGFVGTDSSTMSVLAARRVQDWNGGVTKLVKWGAPERWEMN